MDLLLFLTAAAHLVYTPFTKVEESFNMQAMHDILYIRHNISEYDHHEYPGVVPRTFLGPLCISILSTPFVLLFETLQINKFWAQYVVRIVLAAVISVAWNELRAVITKMYHLEVSVWFTMITLSQFHFMFYMSRALPNIMALPLVLYALTYWLKRQRKRFIICSGVAILVFRSELLIFLGLLLLFDLWQRNIRIDALLKIALPAGLIILVSTIIVDSFFWKRLAWPEGEVLWYNTILNKSANWGTSPFLWYFYSALPRALGFSMLFVPVGVYLEPRVRALVLAAIGFVLIYSLLPHKELRFVIYVLPVLNLAAACACNRFWINSTKSMWQGFLALCAAGHLLLNVFITLFLLVVSSTNYPGGVALMRLHRLEANTTNVTVHISNLAAQSGVSRFAQFRDDWRYCKNEHINYTLEDTKEYTHLLVETKNKQNTQLWNNLQQDFETMEYIDCFNSIGIQYNSLLPVRIKTKPCIVILKRRTEMEKPVEKVTKRSKQHVVKESGSLETIAQSVVNLPEPAHKEELETVEVTVDGDDDGIVTNVDNFSAETITTANETELENDDVANDDAQQVKDINFQELRNLAMGQVTKKTKATKLKIRKIIEQHYRAKGRQIEDEVTPTVPEKQRSGGAARQTVKAIIKQERIKEMIEQIATMDLTRICDLDKMTTKDCLKQVIDKIDEVDERTLK